MPLLQVPHRYCKGLVLIVVCIHVCGHLVQELLTLRKYHKKAKSKKRQTESSAHEMQVSVLDAILCM